MIHQQVEELFQRQTQAWPELAKGIEGLAHARTRPLRINWFDVYIRHIPHRVHSTTAAVDPTSIAKRECFLCARHLPPEEEGLQFNRDFTIYCNPFPIVDRHLTVAHREHRPQGIANQVANILDLAAALPGYFAIYNGPECGASAPDHMHFQAGSRRFFPIANDTAGLTGLTVPNYERSVFLFRDRDRSALINRIDRVLALLAEAANAQAEPMINIAVFHQDGEWVTYIFPRAKHRPDVFYTGELTVSPAAIDLCGIFVVPLAEDFDKISAQAVTAIFREITLPPAQVRAVAAKLESEL